MEVNEYQKSAMTTCTESSRNLPYMVLNLAGEMGELVDKLRVGDWATTDAYREVNNDPSKTAKAIRKGTVAAPIVPKYTEDEINGMKLEAGDILWQLSGFCSVMGWDLEEIAQMNLDKLQSRKQSGTIIGDGDYR